MLALPANPPKQMSVLFPNHSENTNALDLVVKMLDFHPDHRITIENALQHPFLSSLHNPEDEPVADFTFSFDFEHEDLKKERIQELMWEEIRTYHKEIPEKYPSNIKLETEDKNLKGTLKRSIEEK
jgi:mitogen-activated protein kinase 1/3